MSKKLLMNNGGMNNRLRARYTHNSDYFVPPIFNSDFIYEVTNTDNGDGTYTAEIYSDDDFTEVSFNAHNVITLDYLKLTNKVTEIGYMFANCKDIRLINASNWDTSNVTNMSCFLGSFSSSDPKPYLEEIIGIENWDTSNVTTMTFMFKECSALKSLDLSKWNTSSLKDVYSMFEKCSSLTEIIGIENLGGSKLNFSINNSVFSGCSSLKSIDVSKWNLKGNMTNMFNGCSSLTSLKLPSTVANYTLGINFNGTFKDCSSLTSIDLSGWKSVKYIKSMNSTFHGCTNLTEIIGIGDLNFYYNTTRGCTSLEYTFSNCISLESLDLSSWDVSKVTNMYSTFYNCPQLTTLGDISNWDTSSVTNMSGLFAYCSSLELPQLSSWDTGSVTNMSDMFAGRSNQSISDLYIQEWNTSNVTNMSWMFHGCVNGWYDLHLNWDTYNVTNMSNMFNRFHYVQDIYINNWDTSSLTDVTDMFLDCQADSITVSPDFPYTEEDTGYSSYFIREY